MASVLTRPAGYDEGGDPAARRRAAVNQSRVACRGWTRANSALRAALALAPIAGQTKMPCGVAQAMASPGDAHLEGEREAEGNDPGGGLARAFRQARRAAP